MSRQSQDSSRVVKVANMLTVSDRMLHYILVYILVPKHSNHAQVSEMEIQLIRAMKMDFKINWAYVIMHHMKYIMTLRGGLPMQGSSQKFWSHRECCCKGNLRLR